MFTCGPAFFKIVAPSIPPAVITETMDYAFKGSPFVIVPVTGVDTNGLDLVLKSKPFWAQP